MNEIEELKKTKDNAYWERNQLVSALSKLFPSHMAKHPEDDKEWESDWRTIVVIYLPTKQQDHPGVIFHSLPEDKKTYYQLTWHIHDSDIPMFDHLGYRDLKGVSPHGSFDTLRRQTCYEPFVIDPANCHLLGRSFYRRKVPSFTNIRRPNATHN